MNLRREIRSFDLTLAVLVLGLAIFGVILIGSAVQDVPVKYAKEVSKLFGNQIIWVISGLVLMLAAAFINFEFIGKFYIVLYGLNLLLLTLVLVFGDEINNTTRWLTLADFGIKSINFGIQPSEFTKIFMIIYLAKFIDKSGEKFNNIFVMMAIVALSAVPIVLIYIQPSLSASLVPIVILLTMLFVGGMSYKYIIIGLVIIVPLAVFFYYDVNAEKHIIIDKFMGTYQIKRITDFLGMESKPDDHYQTLQSIKAIASGRLTGVGLYNNSVYVPYSYNDFIFSIIGSEFGFMGSMTVLFVIFVIIGKCLLIAHRSELLLGKLMASGVAAMLAFQAFVNVAVSIGLLPNTGIVFPFMSSGGSSMWISMASIGLVINVGMTKSKPFFAEA